MNELRESTMISALNNIQEAYKGFFTQLTDAKHSVQKIFDDTYSDEDKFRVASMGLKILGTLSLAFIAINILSAFNNRSFSILKFTFCGLYFVIGHDSLKTGDNLHKRLAQRIPYREEVLAHGFQEQGKDEWQKVQRVRRQDGFFAALRQGIASLETLADSGEAVLAGDEQEEKVLLSRGLSKIIFEDTIVFKRIFDWAISQTAEE